MCGIFGIVTQGNQNTHLEKYIRKLFLLTEPRGRQASGIAIKTSDAISVYKRPTTSSKFVNSKDYHNFLKTISFNKNEAIFSLGHCRLVTDGSELIDTNNQPIISSNIVGVHNGVLNNIYDFPINKPLNNENERSDSEVFFEYLDSKEFNYQRLYSSLSEIKGAASIGLLHKDLNDMFLYSNFGSLYYQKINEQLIIITSEPSAIIHFCKSFKFDPKPIKLKLNQILAINKGLQLYFPSQINLEETKKTPILNLTPNPKNIKRCTKCILPENYPFISFDSNGVCNMCHKYKRQKFKGRDNLNRVLDQYRSKDGAPDCLLGLSGGRDSSYALHLLKEEFGMNPIGFCYDWLMTSQKARHNISKMADALNVEIIYRCGNYERHAKNIRSNIYGFLKDPDLGMMTFVQAGDKEMYHYGRKLRKERSLGITIWGSGFQLEQREFYVGYCGINKTLVNNPRLYDYGWFTKLQMALFYGFKTLKNPYLWNQSILDNALAFWHSFVAKDDFLYLYEYLPWNESQIEKVLLEKYKWEEDQKHGCNQWRMGDFHTAFTNYVYYTIGGFSEYDDFRSNQIREGIISRDEALKLVKKDNSIRYQSLQEFSRLVGFNLEHVLKEIESVPKLYR